VPSYDIAMTVSYSGVVDAETEEQARDYFIRRRESEFYDGVEDESIEEIEEEE
jgi:hypothetical protein